MPKIFIILSLVLAASWVLFLSGGMDCGPERSSGDGNGQAQAILLVNPKVLDGTPNPTSIFEMYAQSLGQPETIRSLLMDLKPGMISQDTIRAVNQNPEKYIEVSDEIESSTIVLRVRGLSSAREAEKLAGGLAEAFARSAKADASGDEAPIFVTRVIRTH
jgi:hypothetical protein